MNDTIYHLGKGMEHIHTLERIYWIATVVQLIILSLISYITVKALGGETFDPTYLFVIIPGIVMTLYAFFSYVILTLKGRHGWKKHASTEAKFIMQESPNILQFLSFFSVVSILLDRLEIRFIIITAVVMVLFCYLNSKRRKFYEPITQSGNLMDRFILVAVSATSIIILAIISYFLASLISISSTL